MAAARPIQPTPAGAYERLLTLARARFAEALGRVERLGLTRRELHALLDELLAAEERDEREKRGTHDA